MDERWELAVVGGAFWIDDGPSTKLDLLITDGVECGNIYVTPDDAMRIAYELLRRSGKATTQILSLVAERLTVDPTDPTG